MQPSFHQNLRQGIRMKIKRIILASFPNRDPNTKQPWYETYLLVIPTVTIGKGHRQCITGAVATFNNGYSEEERKFGLGFDGAINLGRKTTSTIKELKEVLEVINACLNSGDPEELPPIEVDGDLINPGLALIIPGSKSSKAGKLNQSPNGRSRYKGKFKLGL